MNKQIVIKRNEDNSYYSYIHKKGLETYIYVTFKYDDGDYSCYLPIEDRRKGIDFNISEPLNEDLKTYLSQCRDNLCKVKRDAWFNSHPINSHKKRRDELLNYLRDFKLHPMAGFKEVSNNTNPQKTIQILKDNGITIATIMINGKAHCQLIPLPESLGIPQAETMTKEFTDKVRELLGGIDAYEGKKISKYLLPDHKFPEVRWNESTAKENKMEITKEEAQKKFQLLTNPINLTKREACKKCFAENKRQYPFGIKYYYVGNEDWDERIEKTGPNAEQGCIGCGWYDIQKWREELNKKLEEK